MDGSARTFDISIAAVVILVVVIALALMNGKGGQTNENASRISVTATGTAYAYPSSAIMYILVNGSGSSTLEATSNISATLVELNRSISPFIDGNLSNVKTTSYNIGRSYNASRNKTLYAAVESIRISIPSVDNVSALIGTLSGIPNTYVTSVSAQLTGAQVNALRQQALSLALQNATQQASTLAGGPVSPGNITVNSYAYYPLGASGSFQTFSQTVAGAVPEPFFSAGRGSVTESISVAFYRN